MKKIFLLIRERETGGEPLPKDPVRIFLKKEASTDEKHYIELKLYFNGRKVGEANIDFRVDKNPFHHEGKEFYVGEGSLEDVHAKHFNDKAIKLMILDALKQEEIEYTDFNPENDWEEITEHFQAWIKQNL